jgi:hypothetical protein
VDDGAVRTGSGTSQAFAKRTQIHRRKSAKKHGRLTERTYSPIPGVVISFAKRRGEEEGD